MRITEGRIVELAAQRNSAAQRRVAEAGDELSSGVRVRKPSDDPAAWAAGRRASLRLASSEVRGQAIATADEHLAAAEGALETVGSLATRLRELAVQGANDTYGASERAAIGGEVRALAEQAMSAMNSRGRDGAYVFAGSLGDTPPFDAAGTYAGDSTTIEIETAESSLQTVTVTGEVFTASRGVDVLAAINAFALALETNDIAGIRAAVGDFDTAVEQVARARTEVGAMSAGLRAADESREDFEINLAETIARTTESDAIAAASELARAAQALEASQAVTVKVIELLRRPSGALPTSAPRKSPAKAKPIRIRTTQGSKTQVTSTHRPSLEE